MGSKAEKDAFIYTGDDVLDIMSRYAINRNNSIEKLINKNIHPGNSGVSLKLCEFGAGRGEFINRFAGRKGISTYAVELDEHYLGALKRKHKACKDINDLEEKMDFIYLIDVLEHIEEDEKMLKRLHETLDVNGRIFIYVPARMELFSPFDTRIGHFRRYHKRELRDKLMNAGFHIEEISYHEILGYFAAYYNKFLSKKGELNAGAVKIYDKIIVPASGFIEKIFPVPIGKSLFASAVKKQ
jgi:hypothetical protein